MRLVQRILPPTKLERDLALQCVLSAFATGSFLTGTAVFFTQIVGLSGAQVGLGMSIAAGGHPAAAAPAGPARRPRRRQAAVGGRARVEAVLYFAWPLAGGMAFVAAARRCWPRQTAATPAATSTGSRSSRARCGSGRWPTCGPRATSATPSAPAPAASPWAIGTREAIIAVPLLTGGLLVLNAVHGLRCCRRSRARPPVADGDDRPARRRPGATAASSRCRCATACSAPTRCCSTSSSRCGSSSAPTRRTPCWPGCSAPTP